MRLGPLQRGAAVVAGAVAASVALKRARRATGAIEIQRSISVQLPREEVERRWSDEAVQSVIWVVYGADGPSSNVR